MLAVKHVKYNRYNVEYGNDMIVALPELIYRALQIVAAVPSNGSSSKE